MAVVLTGVLGGLVVALWRAAKAGRGYRLTAGALSGLLGGQILLGAITVWTTRDAYAATAHVILGAILLAMVFTITWWMHRDAFLRTQPASLAK
jgi:heme A synthase